MLFGPNKLCVDCSRATRLPKPSEVYDCKLFDFVQHLPSHCQYYTGSRSPVDVLVVTAVSIEFWAVIKYLHPAGVYAWEEHTTAEAGTFEIGLFEPNGRSGPRFRVAVAQLPMMGLPASAALTSLAIQLFRPTYVVMLGIAAGFSSRTKIGDVIAPDILWDYEAGKWTEDLHGRLHFEARPNPYEIDRQFVRRLRELARDTSYFEACLAKWNSMNGPQGSFQPPRVLIAPLISGASVINARTKMKEIGSLNDIVCGLEMEAFGVAQAVRNATTPLYSPICLILKSVCDVGYDKTDDDQEFAAFTSVMCFKRFMEIYIFQECMNSRPMNRNTCGTN